MTTSKMKSGGSKAAKTASAKAQAGRAEAGQAEPRAANKGGPDGEGASDNKAAKKRVASRTTTKPSAHTANKAGGAQPSSPTANKAGGAQPPSPAAKKARSPQPSSPAPPAEDTLIVGIGASAGGLEAFRQFFSAMPEDSGLAFVLVQHLSPDHQSMLSELLSRCTAMPVAEAADGVRPAANHVYVIPPDATLTVAGGAMQVRKPAPPREQRRPINAFFGSLAEDQGDRAICVVLSGTGSDGAQGLHAVKARGGLVLAQAAFDHHAQPGMPASAVATGLVDAVLPVEQMPQRLLEYRAQMRATGSTGGAEEASEADAEPSGHDGVAGQLADICDVLLAATGHDFSQYKKNTLARRIRRRMLVTQNDHASEYLDYLRHNAQEADVLFHEFLIGVTEFFRDAAAFELLQTMALPALLANKGGADVLRIWVPGCATGEEAYSIAMAVAEVLDARATPKVQVFATDIDDRAIAAARAGRFQAPLKGISEERQRRWFTPERDGWCVNKRIREMCIFSAHSLIKDPPLSRMDLVSCRNLMIYLNAELQQRVAQAFHYALRPGGFLLLGTSERLSRNPRLFTEVDQKHRLYVRNEDQQTRPHAIAAGARRAGGLFGHTQPVPTPAATPERDDANMDQRARRALESWSPPYVVVDAQHSIVLFGGDTRHYLAPSAGAASLNLFQLLDKPLRGVVRAAVLQAFASASDVVREDVSFAAPNGKHRALRLIVRPLADGNEEPRHCVVAFDHLDGPPTSTAPATASTESDDRSRLQALDDELRATRAQLQTAIDLHETANEELKSANEEYQSVNEELQSSNEELETSTEEMQSINEELQTVNAELNSKNEALSEVNSDIRNLLDSTRIATVFLDKGLHIRNYTPAMTELFHLRDSDRGRPLTEISPLVRYPELRNDVAHVLKNLDVVERLLQSIDGAPTYLSRMRCYLTIDDVVDGVVLTFVDVTASQRQNSEHARLAAIVNSSRDAIFGFSLDDEITSWNPSAERIFGLSARDVVGEPLQRLRPDDASDDAKDFFKSHLRAHRLPEFEMTWVRPDRGVVPLEICYSPVRDDDGNLIAGKIIARDVTERHEAQRHTQMMLNELNHRVKNTLASVQAIAMQSLANADSVEDFREAFIQRLLALSNTHNLLASDAWRGASLTAIIHNELKPWERDGGGRLSLSGADIKLDAKAALALGMAIHELATNAGKYGALSCDQGRVSLDWNVGEHNGRSILHMVWAESGGPAVQPPTRRGFGTRLITDGVAYELGGKVALEYPPAGVVCTFDVRLDHHGSTP